MAMKRVCIVGASGKLGKYMVKHALAGNDPELLREMAEIERRLGIVRGEAGACRFDQSQIQEVLYHELMPDLRACLTLPVKRLLAPLLQKVTEREKQLREDPKEKEVIAVFKARSDEFAAKLKDVPAALARLKAMLEVAKTLPPVADPDEDEDEPVVSMA